MKTALLCLDSWAGRRETAVEIIGQDEKRKGGTVIRAITATRLPFCRVLKPGEQATVPTTSLRVAGNRLQRQQKDT